MRKQLVFLLVLAFVLACGKTPIPAPEPAPTEIAVVSVKLDQSALSLTEGESATLQATVSPENASNKTVTWSSSNTSVATVAGGKVSALAEGSAVITAKAGNATATCTVSVVGIPSAQAFFGTFSSDASIINGSGGSTKVILKTDGSWTLASQASWLTVSPTSGNAGETEVTVTSTKNETGANRNGALLLSQTSGPSKLTITQRPYIFSRILAASGTITNGLYVTHSGVKWTRIYAILPVPVSNQYQDVSDFSAGNATVKVSENNGNSYAVVDIKDQFPASGDAVIKEQFHVDSYEVMTKLSYIKDIPAYDKDSEPCRKYLGAEEGDLVDPKNSSIVSVANDLWSKTNGDLIQYAKACYEWTASNMTYGNMNTGLHTITELMKTRKGDCGNFSSVFISLLRAKGIPARHVVMISPTEAGYHVRAEFYIPAYGWIPADPTFKNSNPSGDYFGTFSGKYVIMSFGVNSLCVDPDNHNVPLSLLQNYFVWYWWAQSGNCQFTHRFSKYQ